MKKIEQLTRRTELSKTIKFRAIPVGKTQENIVLARILEVEEQRAEDIKVAKGLIDDVHKAFLDKVLRKVRLANIREYVSLYRKVRSDEEEKQLQALEQKLRTEIAGAFTSEPEYKEIFSDKIIKVIIPEELAKRAKAGEDVSELNEKVKSLKQFYTAFKNFEQIRENLYKDDPRFGRIAHRCINENLPRFIANMSTFERVSRLLDNNALMTLKKGLLSDAYDIKDLFSVDFFDFVLPQSGIDLYNAVIGGYVTEKGEKIQGLNELLNLYKQSTGHEVPKFEKLNKQLLSDQIGKSFYAAGYTTDDEVIADLKSCLGKESEIYKSLDKMKALFENISSYDEYGIYIKNDNHLTSFSLSTFGKWDAVRNRWGLAYDEANSGKKIKSYEKYADKRRKAYGAVKSFSIGEIRDLNAKEWATIRSTVRLGVDEKILAVKGTYDEFISALEHREKGLVKDERAVERIKATLDAYKDLEQYFGLFAGTAKELGRDEAFYSEYTEIQDVLGELNRLYNAVRNYVTKKPYSLDKFKLYFDKPSIMSGWDVNQEGNSLSVLLRKDGLYYVAVMNKGSAKVFEHIPAAESGEECYEKMIYKQIPDASKYISGKQILPQNPPERIKSLLLSKKENKTTTSQWSREDVIEYIRYAQDDFLVNYPCLKDSNGDNYFSFKFKKPEEYQTLKEFFDDVDDQAYSVTFANVPKSYLDKLVNNGEIYLFQIYNKDFSPAAHGAPDLHKLYFKSLFDKDNNGIVRLAGGAELFLRKASLKKEELVCHPANKPMNNKNPLNPNKTRTLPYDVFKDKRFSVDQYELHLSVSFNKGQKTGNLNRDVRKLLKDDPNPYVIGINRGERNLIYVVVIDSEGKIVEQFSLNEIVGDNRGVKIRTDYRDLLDRRERERDAARRNWKSIENIEALKQGYISQVVHKICELVEKYDAVVAIEDLTGKFTSSRAKVEKNVYQKFEKMLTDKFNYLVYKDKESSDKGGVLNGYQLANSVSKYSELAYQNGFLFYMPTYYISKIDPTTGFVDLLKPQYRNIDTTREWIRLFDRIAYNCETDYFEFDVDYSRFPGGEVSPRKDWTLCSVGSRVRSFKNPEKNNELDQEVIEDITNTFKELFDKYGIAYGSGLDLREAMCSVKDADFYRAFVDDMTLLLQMRNIVKGSDDYTLSPVKNASGKFFSTKDCLPGLPETSDANDAYNIARKALYLIKQFKQVDDDGLMKVKTTVQNAEWLAFAQKM